ncbi:hypothetical protein CR513_34326, partial [Mucuna pruriens]
MYNYISAITICAAKVVPKLMALMNYENKRGSGKKLKVHFDLPEDEDYPKLKHSNSCASSKSSLDSNDTDKDDNVDSKYSFCGSPLWSFQGGSVTQSPPLQLMSPPPGYDPNRIPSSIFGNNPTNPLEWSLASNESLFSLHLGNNSFSRDHAFAFNKSGDLPRISDFSSTPPTLPTVQEVDVNAKDKNVAMERHSMSSDSSSEASNSVRGHFQNKTSHETASSTGAVVDLKKTETSAQVGINGTVLDKTPGNYGEPKNITSVSYRSVGSDLSTRSFQFPILTSEGGRTSSSTVESEKQEKSEKQEEQPEKSLQQAPCPKTEDTPKQSGRS